MVELLCRSNVCSDHNFGGTLSAGNGMAVKKGMVTKQDTNDA